MVEERVNSFADVNLAGDFKPEKKPKTKISNEEAEELAVATGFPSRQAKQASAVHVGRDRRYRTGRNKQLNIKVTQEAEDRFYKLADEMSSVPLGEIFDQAVKALIATRKRVKKAT